MFRDHAARDRGRRACAEQTSGLEVTASFFALVRTSPALGRAFTEADGETGSEQKIILSHGLWQTAYAADPAVVGRDLELDGRPFTIVGVMPARFSFFDPDVRFWVPLTFTAPQRSVDTPATRLSYGWYHVGRLAPGADLEQAQAQVDALNAANVERFPDIRAIWINTRFHTVVVRLHETLVRDVSGILYLLWGGAVVRAADRRDQHRESHSRALERARPRARYSPGARREPLASRAAAHARERAARGARRRRESR